MDKEIKEITKTSDRWITIKKNNLQVTISSPWKSDTIETLIEKADELIEKHSETKQDPSYTK